MCMGKVYVGSYEHLMKMRAEFEKGIEKEKPAIEKEIAEMLALEIYEDAKRAYAQIINSWYASYSPKYYNRKMDLKDTGEIVLEGTSVSIYTKSDPLTGHHLGAEGLYDLTIKKGYHGGSTYRGPLYIWSHPTGPAVRSFSPFRAMQSWIEHYHYRSMNSKVKKIIAILRRHYSKYEYFRLFY